MDARRWLPLLLIACLGLLRTVEASDGPGFDLITMKNGDIHQGTVAREAFHFQTPYGTLSIPYGLMGRLVMGNERRPDRLLTRLGDHFEGRLLDEEIVVLRVLDPLLPLHPDDIAEISFTPRRLRHRPPALPDVVETRNGSRFVGRLLDAGIVLETADGRRSIGFSDIHLLDVASLMDGDELRIQVQLNGGSIQQGRPATSLLRVENRYGGILNIPLEAISRLAVGVQYRSGPPAASYRRHLNPAALLRDRMVDGTPGPELILLRGGEFMRGSSDGDDDERPPLPVRLRPFAIGLNEVTFEEYDRFCRETGHELPDDSDWGRGQRPVINVSWKDAVAYTRWLSRKTGQTYRLPSDAEWEYAARAGSRSRFWWGDEPGRARANCEGCGSLWDGDKTAPVGRFPPNAFGLHDTAGNVFEWVADCYHDSFAKAPADGRPLDKPGCGKRVIRGGAWSFPPSESRSANRWRDFPSRRSDDTGFRVVRELPPPARGEAVETEPQGE
ncbi:formylglycine-generating enzyme family protein [Thiohalobacter sp. IOR34]|uniref:formylglycine-generating enzyme family protein n=1 Tax=Thiohalobacter sp. IOR34 TaxID=3057176 RepID=UPI0025B0CE9C|nr:formylglycine-generating enzyme family protein [Thiohalobacter sp. IOR34]WJW75968.1 formylglycine-generating enzyme family protein [Thiohalobacter sp. IOR34]